ncbi:MAG TPA: S41 family peptidase [Gemmataceae bacterium]|jgi:C-terminal peptidase prc|nr:S41 family peptidase [Gemmataceae bacterium]
MPWKRAAIAVLVLTDVAFSAPRVAGPPFGALVVGSQFADHVDAAVKIVAREYVRPVAINDLLVAAVEALYDTARRPRPVILLRDLKAAKSEAEYLALLKEARASLHDVPELADGRDLMCAIAAFTPILDPHTMLMSNATFNGTVTTTEFGFEFEGEAQAARPRRGRRDDVIPDEEAAGYVVPPLPFRVANVKPGSPAQTAGLRPGDMVRQIDGIAADVNSASKAFAALHGAGPDKSDPAVHHLVVDREGNPELRLRIEHRSFKTESLFGVTRRRDNSWNYWIDYDRRIAYVRLGGIETDSGDQLSELLHDLGTIHGLIFDLRWCPGGYIDPATQIASIFLPKGTIAKVKYRNEERGGNSEIHADGGLIRYKAGDYPVLLLVNGETTGGGELIAAALKDNGRAIVAGTRTFGKASIQWTMSIQGLPGYQFKLTGGMYTRPNGKNLQRFPDSKPTDDWGVRPDPDFELPTSADLARKLKELHQLYALRPGDSREALDLDDPAADPQRLRALKLLRESIKDN